MTISFEKYLDEKLMTFGGKPYPNFNQVVILAGGAGSGKGVQRKNLIGISGKVFDVDALKELAMKSNKFAKRIKDETGYDINNFDLKNPENVSKIHEILADVYNLPKNQQATTFQSILTADPRRKPNLIFDVTLKDMGKLESISRNVQELGYDKKNVHLVWVLNSVDIAVKQNQERPRVVPEEILMATHEGVALTMRKIAGMGDKIKKYLDGDIYISFNQMDVDTKKVNSDLGGKYFKEADYIRLKSQGKSPMTIDELEDRVIDKIITYVPNTETWDDILTNSR